MIEEQLLSKVIDENKYTEILRANITLDDFPTQKETFAFVRDYVKENGRTPDYRTVIANFPDFDYYPEVVDGYKYLTSRLKTQTAKRRAFELLQYQATEKFSELDGVRFVKWLGGEVESIKAATEINSNSGTNFAVNGQERKEWYEDAKEHRSNQFIPTPYASLTKALGGGFELGDGVLLMAFTNRGKSWLTSDIGRVSWKSGFGVLHYSPELSKRQQSLRLDTLEGHYNNVKLRRGELDNEQEYFKYLDSFNENNETPYIIKTMEDLPKGLSLDVIESDLAQNPNIKMVIIDGFNLMMHGGRGREAMTETSRRLRQLFGKYLVVGVVAHQTPAASERANNSDNEQRLVTPPKLTDFSETVAVIQDAATVLTFDQYEGIGKISIEKAREPSVGEVIELSCDFNMGLILEEDITSMF